MLKQEPEMHYFNSHCSADVPYFCHFSAQGAALHCHVDFYEFCLVVSGSYTHIYNDVETNVDIGNLMMFAPGQSHELRDAAPNSHHYSLIVKEEFFREFCTQHISNDERLYTQPYTEKKLSSAQFAYISQLISSITYTISPDRFPTANYLLYTLIFSCFETLSSTPANSTKIYAVDLLQRLNNYQILNIDVKEMYADYPISQSALIHDFKNLTGYTIVQYRNLKRMEYAANLLTEANYSITDISSILNISCPGYFSEQFKKVYGMNPKQYQILHAKNKVKKNDGNS